MDNDLALSQNSILTGEHPYATALDLVIAEAEQTLLIFDQNLSTGDFSSLKRFDLIYTFLNNNASSQLTIILHHADFFKTQCPRLFGLLATFGHKMTVYTTNSHAKIAKDCFTLADNKAYIRRIHIDQSRFKYALDDKETVASLNNRFHELLQETADKVTAEQLGL